MTDKKVGIKTGKQTQAGRDVYVTPEGENVSEKSTTFKYKGMWINVPSIYKGQQYDDDTLKLMLEAEIIKPTSTHKNKKAAEKAAQERSKTLEFNQGGDVSAQMDSILPKKGMGYGELIVDNILGLDNEYESFGEKLGKVIDEDELKFLKDAAVGVYEGAKEFITSPVETTKEVVTNIKDSVQRLGSEDLDTRLQSMYGISYDQATDQQVTSAREAVIGDAMTALELIPAAKAATVTAKAASSAIPSGVKADIVGQTKAVFGGDMEFLKGTPTERSSTVGVGAEVVGQDNVSLDDINDYMDLEVQPTKSKKETNPLAREIDIANADVPADLYHFRSSVLGSLDNLSIGKEGMSGFQIKKFLEKRAPKINKTELYWSGLLENLDDNKKYSKQELKNITDRNVPRVDIEVLDGDYVRYRNEQRVNLNVNNNVMQPLAGYREIVIVNKNTKGTEYSAGHYDYMFEPDGNVLAHVRGSFVENNEPDFPIKEKFFLVEELQSDAVQQHTVADKAIAKKIKERETSKPTLGDIGLHYQTEFNDMIFPYHAGGLEFTDKFVKDIDSYNYNFRSIGDQDTAEQAIQLGLTNIIDDMAKLKSGFVGLIDQGYDGNRSKDAIAVILSQKYGLKENSIKRRSIEELDEVDNIFANVLGDYVFGKTAIRKFNKENNNEFKEDLINIFKSINITAGLEKDLVPAKLSDTIRMSLLAVIKESKSEGVNKIYIPTPEVISKAHDLSLEAAKNTYSDGVRKVLRTLNNETNGKIKFKNKNPEGISYYENKDAVGIEIDITDFNLPDNPQFRFAKGGVVKDMDNQMEMALMQEGGLQDDGMSQDPVSGNEIPNGSMASEVRDDIPAQLSEGEYVVPADVVRFFGVKFFEDLRSEAKMGLQQMDKDGRIGGEPVAVTAIMGAAPISDAELDQLIQQELSQEARPAMAMGGLMTGQQPTMQQQPMMQPQQPMMQTQPNLYQQQQQMMYNKPTINMNKGGFISTSMESLRAGYALGGSVTGFDPSKYSYGGTGYGMGSGLKVVQYVNDAGSIRWYSFIDGKIQPPGTKIPAGYKPSDPSLNAPLPETPVTPPPDTGITPPDSGDRDPKDDDGNGSIRGNVGGSNDGEEQPLELELADRLSEVDWDGDLLEQAKGFVQNNQGQDISKLGGIAALLGGPGAIIGGVMGVAGKVQELKGISSARALALVVEARGGEKNKKIANSINDFVDGHVKARGGLIDFADGFAAAGTMTADSFARNLGFDNLEDAIKNQNEYNKTFKSRETGFVGVMGDMTAQERKAMIDKANKDAEEKRKAAKAKKSSGSSSDDRYRAADAMKDRLDRMAKAQGQSEGFQGSVTSGSVYAGGNRAKGGLMLKKKNK